eukprot:3932066-Pyramimonas_sp.AAC.1
MFFYSSGYGRGFSRGIRSDYPCTTTTSSSLLTGNTLILGFPLVGFVVLRPAAKGGDIVDIVDQIVD